MEFIMKPDRRRQLHENIREEIKSVARKQITESSVSSLSLGAIARELGVTTPALYRYFPSRDDLVNALIADAYTSFTESLEAARDAVPAGDHAGRFRGLCMAYHAWAVAHPQQYILIFGTPVPGYSLDTAAGEVADRSFQVLLDVINEAAQAGRINFSFQDNPSIKLQKQLERTPPRGKSYPAPVMYLALVSWSFIHGVTSLELYQRYAGILANRTDEFVRLEVERFIRYIGMA
jgi:AcrR family transcriptional regulator